MTNYRKNCKTISKDLSCPGMPLNLFTIYNQGVCDADRKAIQSEKALSLCHQAKTREFCMNKHNIENTTLRITKIVYTSKAIV